MLGKISLQILVWQLCLDQTFGKTDQRQLDKVPITLCLFRFWDPWL